jgi:poly-gamma-glutamate capsule biosynthesis protein CapA/YwtB (metallophosphatase superfamily)
MTDGPAPVYAAEASNIDMVLTGDSVITRPMSVFREPAFLDLVDLVRCADVAITNAETLFHEFENPPGLVAGGSYMASAPGILSELEWLGIGMVSAANNHAYDFGENGLLTSMEHLRSSNLVFAGIGRNMGEARQPRYLDTKNGRVALVAATSSGPAAMYAGHQWRDGEGRPGANMIRHTSRYTVDAQTFEGLRRMRDELGLLYRLRDTGGLFRNHSLGASSLPDSDDEFFMGDLHSQWQYVIPNGYRFARGDGFAVSLVPDQQDLEDNIQRIRDARRMADWVVVSFHNHEQGRTVADPSDVTTAFAHAAIDAGADVFHGHGPHRDRGIEIYRGKPIFYSIGHFIFQNETVEHVPLDNIRRQGLDPWEAMPADFYDSRSGREWGDEWLAHGTNPASFEDAVASVRFRGRQLSEVTLHPIDLGFRRPRSQRGRPVLATGQTAEEVLALFERLSAPFGTRIERRGGLGVVAL